MDSIKYNAVLATAGAITGFSEEKLNQELGLESLQQRIENCYFFKQTTKQSSKYLFNKISLLGVHTEKETSTTFLGSLLDINFLEIRHRFIHELGLSYFRNHKFKCSFQDLLNPI